MLLFATVAWCAALPTAVYEGTWPALSPDGERVAWLRGERAPRQVCVTPVRSPTDCVAGPEATWVRWVDAATVIAGTPEAPTLVDAATGVVRPISLPADAAIRVIAHGKLLVESPLGTMTWMTVRGEVASEPVSVRKGVRSLVSSSGDIAGGLRYQSGADPTWVDILDSRGRHVATRWLYQDGNPDRWSLLSRVVFSGAIYAIDTTVGDHGAVERIDLATGRSIEVFRPSLGVVTGALLGTDGEPDAIQSTWARAEWTVLDPTLKADFEWLAAHVDGDIDIESRSEDATKWLLSVTPGSAPTYAAVYDQTRQIVTRVPPSSGPAESWPWAITKVFQVTTRDGLAITSYLTRPDATRFAGPRPLIVALHGGPWGARFRWSFDPEAQRHAEQGRATLRVNFRGSGGHGRAFTDAGRGEWADAMRTDVYDAIRSAVDDGVADPTRVALVGGSYGGYATLAASIFAPSVAKCGVSIHGPPNVPFIWTRPPDLGKQREIQLGPSAPRVGFPLLMIAGDADKIVPIAPVRRFARKAAAAGRPVTLLTLPGEGHDATEAAWDAVSPWIDHFLTRCFEDGSPLPVEASPLLRVEVGGEAFVQSLSTASGLPATVR